MEYELYHHGIKGMRWGIRRYQNKDGSLTPAGEKRLENYKEKELDRVTKKYQTDKLRKKLNKVERQYGDYLDDHAVGKVSKARYRVLKSSGMEYMEKRKIVSMTYQDMMKEQTDLRKAKVNRFIKGLGQKTVGLIIGESSPSLFVNSDLFKTNRRVGLEESIYNEYEARKSTGYRGL